MIETKVEFKEWPKIQRNILGSVVITEKMDGTNACVIVENGDIAGVQSRNRMLNIGKENDNHGFAQYVFDNKEMFVSLGDGRHYGEWVGAGINGNRHNFESKRFYLFNTRRFGSNNPAPEGIFVVPVLYAGPYSDQVVEGVMSKLMSDGKLNGYTPEGCVVYFPKIDQMEKHTFEYSGGKWTGVK